MKWILLHLSGICSHSLSGCYLPQTMHVEPSCCYARCPHSVLHILHAPSQSPYRLCHCSVIMVDEVHERTVATDLLLGLLKLVQKRRPDLRIVISSATLEARKMASFFDTRTVRTSQTAEQTDSPSIPSAQPAIVSVEGRVHTVQVPGLHTDLAHCRKSGPGVNHVSALILT